MTDLDPVEAALRRGLQAAARDVRAAPTAAVQALHGAARARRRLWAGTSLLAAAAVGVGTAIALASAPGRGRGSIAALGDPATTSLSGAAQTAPASASPSPSLIGGTPGAPLPCHQIVEQPPGSDPNVTRDVPPTRTPSGSLSRLSLPQQLPGLPIPLFTKDPGNLAQGEQTPFRLWGWDTAPYITTSEGPGVTSGVPGGPQVRLVVWDAPDCFSVRGTIIDHKRITGKRVVRGRPGVLAKDSTSLYLFTQVGRFSVQAMGGAGATTDQLAMAIEAIRGLDEQVPAPPAPTAAVAVLPTPPPAPASVAPTDVRPTPSSPVDGRGACPDSGSGHLPSSPAPQAPAALADVSIVAAPPGFHPLGQGGTYQSRDLDGHEGTTVWTHVFGFAADGDVKSDNGPQVRSMGIWISDQPGCFAPPDWSLMRGLQLQGQDAYLRRYSDSRSVTLGLNSRRLSILVSGYGVADRDLINLAQAVRGLS